MYCKNITKNHCYDNNCTLKHTKTLFVNPAIIYMYYEDQNDTYDIYYTYDFEFYFVNQCYANGKVYNDEKIYKSIDERYYYFGKKIMNDINLLKINYNDYFDIFMLTTELIPIQDISNIVMNNMRLHKFFKIKCDS